MGIALSIVVHAGEVEAGGASGSARKPPSVYESISQPSAGQRTHLHPRIALQAEPTPPPHLEGAIYLPLVLRRASVMATATPTPQPTATPTPTPTTVVLKNDNGVLGMYSEEWRQGDTIGTTFRAAPVPYPLRLEGVQFLLWSFEGAAKRAELSVLVYDITPEGQPGTLLGRSARTVVSDFYPTWVTVGLRPLNLVVDGPFMIALKYEIGEAGTVPSILLDNASNIPRNINWYSEDGGETWTEHYGFWIDAGTVGHNIVRAVVRPIS